MAVGLWECGLLEGHAFASEGHRTFVGLTVHGRLEGKHESRLRSSPAEGLTVTKAETDRRGEAGVVPPPHPLWQEGFEGRARGSGACPVVWYRTRSRLVRRRYLSQSLPLATEGMSRGGVAARNVRITPLDFFAWTHFLNAQLLASLV